MSTEPNPPSDGADSGAGPERPDPPREQSKKENLTSESKSAAASRPIPPSTVPATEKTAAEKVVAEKVTTQKVATEEAATEKAASEKAETEKAATEKAATEKAATEKAATKKAATEKAAAGPSERPTSLPEVFIAVLGQTGTGKSSFINQVTGGKLEVGHRLASCTHSIQFASTIINRQKVTLIDTPGFDESSKDDGEILTLISVWLKRAHKEEKLLNGVIYLHRISDPRMQGGSVRSLMILKKMCGTKTYDTITLATTMWDMVSTEVAEDHERELKIKWWEHIIAGGGKVYRHNKKEESAKEIITAMLPNPSVVLNIQTELDLHGVVGRTSAGVYVKEHLEKIKEEHAEEVTKLRKLIDDLQKQREASELVEEALRRDLSKAEEELKKSSGTIEKLTADIQRMNTKLEELETRPEDASDRIWQLPFLTKVWDTLKGWDAV